MPLSISKPAFNLRSKINELDGTIPYHKLPKGTVIFLGTSISGNVTNMSSNQVWTTLTGVEIKVVPKFSDSQLWIEHIFSMENYDKPHGIGFRAYRAMPSSDGGGDVKVYESYQHSHWDGSTQWDGPGQIVISYMDVPGTSDRVQYYVQAYKETGNNLYTNYGQDSSGIRNNVWEIKQ